MNKIINKRTLTILLVIISVICIASIVRNNIISDDESVVLDESNYTEKKGVVDEILEQLHLQERFKDIKYKTIKGVPYKVSNSNSELSVLALILEQSCSAEYKAFCFFDYLVVVYEEATGKVLFHQLEEKKCSAVEDTELDQYSLAIDVLDKGILSNKKTLDLAFYVNLNHNADQKWVGGTSTTMNLYGVLDNNLTCLINQFTFNSHFYESSDPTQCQYESINSILGIEYRGVKEEPIKDVIFKTNSEITISKLLLLNEEVKYKYSYDVFKPLDYIILDNEDIDKNNSCTKCINTVETVVEYKFENGKYTCPEWNREEEIAKRKVDYRCDELYTHKEFLNVVKLLPEVKGELVHEGVSRTTSFYDPSKLIYILPYKEKTNTTRSSQEVYNLLIVVYDTLRDVIVSHHLTNDFLDKKTLEDTKDNMFLDRSVFSLPISENRSLRFFMFSELTVSEEQKCLMYEMELNIDKENNITLIQSI